MRFFFGFTILIIVILYLYIRSKRQFDLFAPDVVLSLLFLIEIAFPTFIYSFDVSGIDNFFIVQSVLDDDVYVKFVILQITGYVFMICGCNRYHCSSKKNSIDYNIIYSVDKQIIYRRLGIVFALVGMIFYYLLMIKIGGIAYFFENIQHRSEMVRSGQELRWGVALISFGTLMFVYAKALKLETFSLKILIILILAGFIAGLGGRRSILMIILQAFFIYHFVYLAKGRKNWVQRGSGKIIVMALLLTYISFMVILMQRKGEFFTDEFHLLDFLINISYNFINNITSESYVSFFMALQNYVDHNDLWWGSSFSGLITGIIPSFLYPLKPPVDDGMYLYSICMGRSDIYPSMPFVYLDGSSLPLETFGSMYANFGVIGFILGCFFIGMLCGVVFRKLMKNPSSLFLIIFYTILLFTFELSTLRIFQTVQGVLILSLVCWIGDRFLKNVASTRI